MELEELKQNWNIMEERLGRLEMDQRQQLNNKVVSKVKKVQDRVLRRFTIVVICLPFFCWYIVHNQMCDFSMSTWVLLFLFGLIATGHFDISVFIKDMLLIELARAYGWYIAYIVVCYILF